jgi:hypothetical protein
MFSNVIMSLKLNLKAGTPEEVLPWKENPTLSTKGISGFF